MKTKFTFFLFALYFINASAQIENFIKTSTFPDEINTQNRHVNKLLIKKKLDSLVTTYTDDTYQDSKTYYTYNSNGLETESTTYKRGANQWLITFKKIKDYDNQNRKIQEISMKWENGTWQNTYKTTYQYNPDNLLESLIFYIWDDSLQTWTEKNKGEYFYNSAQLLVINNGYTWDASQWNLTESRHYSYDSNNRLIQSVIEKGDNGNLINNHRTNYTYNSSGQLIEYTTSDWDETGLQWNETHKVDYTYNSFGKVTEKTMYIMGTSNWQESTKFYINYDNYQNVTDYSSYAFYDVGWWILLSRVEFVHDNSFSHDQLVLPENINFGGFDRFSHQLTQELYYVEDDTSATGVSLEGSSELYYSDIDVNGINDNNKDDFVIYPNPASQNIQIQLNTEAKNNILIVYDLTGKEVLRYTLVEKHTSIDIHQLQKGMYFYQLKNKQGINAGKLLIE